MKCVEDDNRRAAANPLAKLLSPAYLGSIIDFLQTAAGPPGRGSGSLPHRAVGVFETHYHSLSIQSLSFILVELINTDSRRWWPT